MEIPPRTRIEIPALGSPSVCCTFTPAIRPAKASATLDTGALASSSALTDATEPVISLRFIVP